MHLYCWGYLEFYIKHANSLSHVSCGDGRDTQHLVWPLDPDTSLRPPWMLPAPLPLLHSEDWHSGTFGPLSRCAFINKKSLPVELVGYSPESCTSTSSETNAHLRLWHPGKFPKVPGRRRGTRGFPTAPPRKMQSLSFVSKHFLNAKTGFSTFSRLLKLPQAYMRARQQVGTCSVEAAICQVVKADARPSWAL